MSNQNRSKRKKTAKNQRRDHVQKQSLTKLVVSDMDSTLGHFWGYFCPAMREIAPMLSAKLGVEQSLFERELGRVMHSRGTHEWPWIMELTSFRHDWPGTPKTFREKISEPFWQVLDEMRARYLQPFDDVPETIAELHRKGIEVAILSDAPFYMALTRACDMGLDGKIDALYALEVPEPNPADFVDPRDLELGLERISRLEGRPHNFKWVKKLDKHLEKPSPLGLSQVLQDFGADFRNTIFIGDSVKKDGGAAQACGVPFIWARYGVFLPPEYVDMVDRRFTPDGQIPKSGHGVSYRPSVLPPMIAQAASYGDLLKGIITL